MNGTIYLLVKYIFFLGVPILCMLASKKIVFELLLTISEKCTPPCQNDGKCQLSGKCKCSKGFHGDFCQNMSQRPRGDKMLLLKKSCTSRPCKNGGSCNHFTGKCICPPGYRGRRCHKNTGRKYLQKLFILIA